MAGEVGGSESRAVGCDVGGPGSLCFHGDLSLSSLPASADEAGPILIWEAECGRPLQPLVSLNSAQAIVLSPDGHYRGSPRVERELICVVETDGGQGTLSPKEFAAKYGWKNDPDRVRLLPGALVPGARL